jgi:hypothetical protein
MKVECLTFPLQVQESQRGGRETEGRHEERLQGQEVEGEGHQQGPVRRLPGGG